MGDDLHIETGQPTLIASYGEEADEESKDVAAEIIRSIGERARHHGSRAMSQTSTNPERREVELDRSKRLCMDSHIVLVDVDVAPPVIIAQGVHLERPGNGID